MLNRVNGKRELDRVNMLIRALSAEITNERVHNVEGGASNIVPVQMQEALYELRLRKLLISAVVCSGRNATAITRH